MSRLVCDMGRGVCAWAGSARCAWEVPFLQAWKKGAITFDRGLYGIESDGDVLRGGGLISTRG